MSDLPTGKVSFTLPSRLLVFGQLRYQQEVLGHPVVQISAGGRFGGPESGRELSEVWGTGMMASEGIGALLRGIREAAGLTREEQAALLQAAQGGKWFDPENLKRWETEKRLPRRCGTRFLLSATEGRRRRSSARLWSADAGEGFTG
ncbi:hypothetical protein AB0N60_20195 [Streptomyces microflavus]|uniref:hypothetical protein n=2 Tax=Streptomyces microflavus TaxID=1919 RepID=UPI0033309ACF